MSENPLQLLFKTYEKVSNSIQSQLAHFISVPKPPSSHNDDYSFSLGLSSSSSKNLPPSKSPTSQHSELPKQEKNGGPVTKEDLGRATWTFLHTLGAQQYAFINNIVSTQLSKYPDKPTRQQKRDVKELMAILSRMYPCKECADHFKEVLRANPVQAGSQAEFSQWLCYMHNVVNRSLNKPIFPCDRVDARWGKLDCEQRACDLQGTDKFWP